jgi:hypothetical protein
MPPKKDSLSFPVPEYSPLLGKAAAACFQKSHKNGKLLQGQLVGMLRRCTYKHSGFFDFSFDA